jgi:hypothetical protein
MKRLLEASGWTETAGGNHVVKVTKPETQADHVASR